MEAAFAAVLFVSNILSTRPGSRAPSVTPYFEKDSKGEVTYDLEMDDTEGVAVLLQSLVNGQLILARGN